MTNPTTTRLSIIQPNEIILGEKIGKGTFGEVYKGKCRGADVAVKILINVQWEESVVRDFKREIELMTRLVHPNTVLCMGACVDGLKAIVMEYLPQGNLNAYLTKNYTNPIPLSNKIQFALEICKGMSWLAAQNILHRDLKPDNIMLDSNDVCKVGDFGLSQILEGGQKIRDNNRKGSPYWMAPEVLSKGEIDTKADVFSFGLVFWQILALQPHIYEDYTEINSFAAAVAKGLRPPLDKIPPVFARILSRTWAPNPRDRPTFQELVKLLEGSIIEHYFEVCVCDEHQRPFHKPLPNINLSFRTGAWFWQHKVPAGDTSVRLDKFIDVLDTLFARRKDTPQLLKKLVLTSDKQGNEILTIENFVKLLLWFGDIQDVATKASIYDHIQQICKQPWFFGKESSSEVTNHLLNAARAENKNYYCVRLNTGETVPVDEVPFTISHVMDGAVKHMRVYFKDDRKRYVCFTYSGVGVERENKGMVDFVRHVVEKYGPLMGEPCPRSMAVYTPAFERN